METIPFDMDEFDFKNGASVSEEKNFSKVKFSRVYLVNHLFKMNIRQEYLKWHCLFAGITVDVKIVEGRNDTGPKSHTVEMREQDKRCSVMSRLSASIDVPKCFNAKRS